mmetsp:Transcript_13481/g.53532  ORF Transcript_13481/g.53532 Transcript_13481/m.53532 type:complete len:130 (+) Transcript_13481:43-432(+)
MEAAVTRLLNASEPADVESALGAMASAEWTEAIMGAALGSGVLPRLSELATGTLALEAPDAARAQRLRCTAAKLLCRAVLAGDDLVRAAALAFGTVQAIGILLSDECRAEDSAYKQDAEAAIAILEAMR